MISGILEIIRNVELLADIVQWNINTSNYIAIFFDLLFLITYLYDAENGTCW